VFTIDILLVTWLIGIITTFTHPPFALYIVIISLASLFLPNGRGGLSRSLLHRPGFATAAGYSQPVSGISAHCQIPFSQWDWRRGVLVVWFGGAAGVAPIKSDVS
jgi:hypothetical protein